MVANLALFGAPANAPLVWAYMQDNWDAIIAEQEASG